ncbi:MAG: EamA family transporter [Lachnospiraceae bacterium]|nr:EamA family transporter [Lachnospiraceae bacterium]
MKNSSSGYIYIVLCALIFSTMEVMLKVVHGIFAPMQITMIRFLIGGILLIPFAMRSMKEKGVSFDSRDIPFFALTGFLCVSFSMVLYQMAITYTKASVVALIFSSNPIFVTVLAHLILHEAIHLNHVAALVIEVIAITVIVSPWNTQLSLTGVLLSVAAAVVFALYGVVGKKRTGKYGGIAVTCFSFVLGGTELLLLLLLGKIPAIAAFYRGIGLSIFAEVPILTRIPLSAVPAFLYICIVNSAAGFVCHMKAFEKTSAQEASLIFFLKPMIAPIIAYVFLHEDIPLNMIIGIILFLIGSGISVIPGIVKLRRAKAQEASE